MKNKILIYTGFPRTATMGMVKFMAEFGVISFHQRCCPPEYLRLMKYNFRKPPEIVKNYIENKIEDLAKFNKDHFEASWDFGNFIYLLNHYVPNINFIIGIRDPEDACNSLTMRNPSMPDIQTSAIQYILCYHSILSQIRMMENKPCWIDFKAYTKGKYTKPLLGYFGIETDDDKAKEILSIKVNSSGAYHRLNLPLLFEAGRQITREIMFQCREFS